jgi:hypothetical protein
MAHYQSTGTYATLSPWKNVRGIDSSLTRRDRKGGDIVVALDFVFYSVHTRREWDQQGV